MSIRGTLVMPAGDKSKWIDEVILSNCPRDRCQEKDSPVENEGIKPSQTHRVVAC